MKERENQLTTGKAVGGKGGDRDSRDQQSANLGPQAKTGHRAGLENFIGTQPLLLIYILSVLG